MTTLLLNPSQFSYGKNNLVLREDGKVVVLYPKGSINPSHKTAPVGGFGASVPFEKETDKVSFTYQISFPPDFDWVKGGKLHGIYFHSTVSGGKKKKKGGSIRLMWRKNGIIDVYVYHPQMKQKYGESHFLKTKFDAGKVHTVKIDVDLPSIKVQVDDEILELKRDFQSLATGIFFSTFFGGHSKEWSAKKDEKITFQSMQYTIDGHVYRFI